MHSVNLSTGRSKDSNGLIGQRRTTPLRRYCVPSACQISTRTFVTC